MLSLGLCQLEQQVKSSPPPRMLDMEEGNQPAIIICCSGTRAPPWAVLSGVPVYSLLLQVPWEDCSVSWTGIPGLILGTLIRVEPLDLRRLGCGADSPRQAARH